jgi:pyridinium-3,5-bisthiocarboxylic acid mononucleotide nickel chelatase
MTHIHIDMLGGIAGDMFLAASIDAGLVEIADIERALSSLGVGDVRVVANRVRRGAIAGTHVSFTGWDRAEERDHRHLSTILKMLDDSGLSEPVRQRAKQMFETLGASESEVHDIPMERVHFHECGALDSIFDFVAAAYIIETAGASWSAGPVPTGSGTVETDHGTVPVPVPATADILAGFELVARPVQAELVTPTGATILKTLRQISPDFTRPQAVAAQVGYGAGTRELDELSNVVRLFVLEPTAEAGRGLQRDQVARLTCEIDDMNPELFAAVEERLFEAGALDVVREVVLMKKGRQGTRVSVLCPPELRDALAEAMLRQTTSFGVRVEQIERMTLPRELVQVDTSAGKVRVKLGRLGDEVIQASPEYEDCARLAEDSGRPVREIFAQARAAAQHLLD